MDTSATSNFGTSGVSRTWERRRGPVWVRRCLCLERRQGFQARGLVVRAPGSNVHVLEATRMLDVSLSLLKLYYNVMSPCIFFSKKMVPCVPYARADNKDKTKAQIARLSSCWAGTVRQQLCPSRIPPLAAPAACRLGSGSYTHQDLNAHSPRRAPGAWLCLQVERNRPA